MRAPFRRKEALEAQRRRIDELSAAVESLVGERSHAGPGGGERAASARLDEISAKLDRLLAARHEPDARSEVVRRQVYVSELGEVRVRRVAGKGAL